MIEFRVQILHPCPTNFCCKTNHSAKTITLRGTFSKNHFLTPKVVLGGSASKKMCKQLLSEKDPSVNTGAMVGFRAAHCANRITLRRIFSTNHFSIILHDANFTRCTTLIIPHEEASVIITISHTQGTNTETRRRAVRPPSPPVWFQNKQNALK